MLSSPAGFDKCGTGDADSARPHLSKRAEPDRVFVDPRAGDAAIKDGASPPGTPYRRSSSDTRRTRCSPPALCRARTTDRTSNTEWHARPAGTRWLPLGSRRDRLVRRAQVAGVRRGSAARPSRAAATRATAARLVRIAGPAGGHPARLGGRRPLGVHQRSGAPRCDQRRRRAERPRGRACRAPATRSAALNHRPSGRGNRHRPPLRRHGRGSSSGKRRNRAATARALPAASRGRSRTRRRRAR